MRLIRILLLLCVVSLGILYFLPKRTVVKPSTTEVSTGVIAFETVVKRVVDGDTIELVNGDKVRYIGINTPESVDPRKGVQCFGKEAAEFNKGLVEGKKVWLEKDVTETDKYGRLLRIVYLDNPTINSGAVMVNEELVAKGFAGVYTVPPDVKYKDRFLAAQKIAVENKFGLWKSCPVRPR